MRRHVHLHWHGHVRLLGCSSKRRLAVDAVMDGHNVAVGTQDAVGHGLRGGSCTGEREGERERGKGGERIGMPDISHGNSEPSAQASTMPHSGFHRLKSSVGKLVWQIGSL